MPIQAFIWHHVIVSLFFTSTATDKPAREANTTYDTTITSYKDSAYTVVIRVGERQEKKKTMRITQQKETKKLGKGKNL